jgi:hypothetical protein
MALGGVESGALELIVAPEAQWLELPKPGLVLHVDPPLLPALAEWFVEESSNLRDWSALGDLEASSHDGGLSFLIPGGLEPPCGFFRLRQSSQKALPESLSAVVRFPNPLTLP